MSWQRMLRLAAAVAALTMGGSGWLVWVESGAVGRSSYEAFDSAQRLGLDGSYGGPVVRVVWFLLPVVSLTVAGLALLGRRRATSVTMVVAAAIAGVGGVGVLIAPVQSGPGPYVALVGATVGVLVGMAQLLQVQSSR